MVKIVFCNAGTSISKCSDFNMSMLVSAKEIIGLIMEQINRKLLHTCRDLSKLKNLNT